MSYRVVAAAVVLVSASLVWGQEDAGGASGGRAISLPTTVADNAGSAWMIYANGMVQQQGGGMPVFGQLGNFTLNGGAANANRINFGNNFPNGIPNGVMIGGGGAMANVAGGQGPGARIDDRTGEVTISNLAVGGFVVTRRVLIEKETGVVRFADTVRNATAGEKAATLTYNGNFNFGLQSSRQIVAAEGKADAKKPNQPLGWVGMTGNNRAVFSAYGLSGGKVVPKIVQPEGTNVLTTTYTFPVPPMKEVTVVHYHGSTDTVDKAAGEVSAARFSKFTGALPEGVRRSLGNVPVRGTVLPEDLEILRGDQTDVIETATGDLLRGTFQDKTFALTTFFGKAELPASKVVSILTVGRQRPMHLLVTTEGEIFGGSLDLPALSFQLASGQAIKVPLSQFRRAGARRVGSGGATTKGSGGEVEIGELKKPVVMLRNGQRLAVAAPEGAWEFASRYGPMSIPAGKISELTLYSAASPVHQVTLTDGSKFSAIAMAPKFDLTLDGAVGPKAVSVPTAMVAALQPVVADGDDGPAAGAPQLRTVGSDLFVGVLSGALQLDTAFETIEIPAEGVRSIRRASENAEGSTTSSELKVTQWDGTVITGTPKAITMALTLSSGLSVAVPADLVMSFENPRPRPSALMADSVKGLIAKLNDDDFKTREAAQAQLIATGAAIVPLLKEAREAQPAPAPEVAQRLDAILGQLEGK